MNRATLVMFFMLIAFGSSASAEKTGTCPQTPPVSSPKSAARLVVSATDVTATVVAVVSDTGYVCDARLVQQADKEVATEITSTVRQWHFDPAMKDGRPVPVVVAIEVNVKRDEKDKIVVSSKNPDSSSRNEPPLRPQ